MATNATDLVCAHIDDQRLAPDDWNEACALPTYVRDVEQSKALTANPMPKVIISASGMATGGRVLHHIKRLASDPRNTILFAGFQTPGTRGRAMIDGVRDVKIHGEWIEIRAEVADLTMLSAHADSNEIIRWLNGFESPPAKTFIVHGDPNASLALRHRIETNLGWSCVVPGMGKLFSLETTTSPLSRVAS